jgi:hypothetical protein
MACATESPRGVYVIDRDTTPDDLCDINEVGLYRHADGTVGPLFTPDELDRIGSLYDGPPLPIRRRPDYAERLEAWHEWLRRRHPDFYAIPPPAIDVDEWPCGVCGHGHRPSRRCRSNGCECRAEANE